MRRSGRPRREDRHRGDLLLVHAQEIVSACVRHDDLLAMQTENAVRVCIDRPAVGVGGRLIGRDVGIELPLPLALQLCSHQVPELSPDVAGRRLPKSGVLAPHDGAPPRSAGRRTWQGPAPPRPASATKSAPFLSKARPRGLSRLIMTGVTVAGVATPAPAAASATQNTPRTAVSLSVIRLSLLSERSVLGCRYSTLDRATDPLKPAFRRRIALVCSCETRDSVTPSTSPISRNVRSS